MELARLSCDDGLTDKNSTHSYLPTYAMLFSPVREAVANVLEIGVQRGGSVAMWHAYFPNATITCVDVDPAPPLLKDCPRARFVRGDAYSQVTLDALGDRRRRTYDIMIDDGPHTLQSMLFFVREYCSKLLAPGGIAVVEDVQDVAWIPRLEAAVPDGCTHHTVDLRHLKDRYDDVLFMVRRPTGCP